MDTYNSISPNKSFPFLITLYFNSSCILTDAPDHNKPTIAVPEDVPSEDTEVDHGSNHNWILLLGKVGNIAFFNSFFKGHLESAKFCSVGIFPF